MTKNAERAAKVIAEVLFDLSFTERDQVLRWLDREYMPDLPERLRADQEADREIVKEGGK